MFGKESTPDTKSKRDPSSAFDPSVAYAWFEVWVTDVTTPPSVLILFGDESRQVFDVYDPTSKAMPCSARSYQDAMFWLTEDEYTKVDGRMAIE
jgi:hypothetical protein